jgi:proline iminopeptidase
MSIAHVNDTDLFYLEVGAGVPCLVMHGGLGLDHTYLHPWLDPLDHALHLVYYDQRGNGRSAHPSSESLTFEQWCADADALREHLGFDRIAMLGHSYGGFIALEYALRYPNRLSHLILLDTAPAMNYHEEIHANMQRKGATEEMFTAWSSPISDDATFQHLLEVVAPLYYHTYNDDLACRQLGNTVYNAATLVRSMQMLADWNVTPYLAKILIPTLILVGRDDFVTPPSQAMIMSDSIPNSEVIIFERSGHHPYVEEPGAFFATVRTWLSRNISLSL